MLSSAREWESYRAHLQRPELVTLELYMMYMKERFGLRLLMLDEIMKERSKLQLFVHRTSSRLEFLRLWQRLCTSVKDIAAWFVSQSPSLIETPYFYGKVMIMEMCSNFLGFHYRESMNVTWDFLPGRRYSGSLSISSTFL